jgi:hypothetical protein
LLGIFVIGNNGGFMLKRHGLLMSVVVLIFVSTAAWPLSAEIHKRPKGIFGLKAGMLGSGTARSDNGLELDVLKSFTGGFFLEFPLFRGDFLTGVAADIYNVKYWSEDTEPEMIIDLSWTFKGNIGHRTKKIIIRPGFAIGYAFFKNSTEIDITGITLKAFMETIFKTRSNVGFLAEIGIIGSPSAGNEYISGKAGPMLLLRGGMVF